MIRAIADSDHLCVRISWGSKKTQRDEVTQLTNIGSQVTSGGDLTLKSGGDQRYQVAKLNSGNDLTIDSGGAIAFEGVKDLHQESHEKSKNSLAWTSMSGKGNTDETLRQTQMIAKGELAIRAVDGLKIDIKEVNEQTVSQTIDAMVKADPQLAWLKEAEKRGDVDWQLIKETHDAYKYSHSSLGQGAMLAIIIIVTVITAGAGTFATTGAAAGSVAGSAASAAGLSTAAVTTVTAATNVAVVASLTSLTSQAVVSTINNRGDLGAVFKDLTSDDSLKNLAISGLTAGFTAGVIKPQFGGTTQPYNGLTKGFDLSDLSDIGGFALHAGAEGVASGTIKTAIKGGSLSDNIVGGLVSQAGNVAAAIGFNYIGNYVQQQYVTALLNKDSAGQLLWVEGGLGRVALHALMGGAISTATGGDFASGAIAAGASQAMAGVLNDVFRTHPEFREAASQIVGLTVAGLAGKDVEKASWIALVADQYNRQLHSTERELAKALAEKSGGKFTAQQIEDQLRLSYITGTEIHPAKDMVATKAGIYDTGGDWIELGDSGQYVQNFARADKDVIAFIKQYVDIYSWAVYDSSNYPPISVGSGSSNGARDRLTGYSLDGNGGYRVPVAIDGVIYTPRYFPCGSAECIANGANIDFSDVKTLVWLKAVDAKAISDIGWMMGVAAVPTNGAAATLLSNGSTAASLLSSYLKDDLPTAAGSAALGYSFERFAIARGVPEKTASKISIGLGAAGVWDTIAQKSTEIFKGD